MHRHKWQVKEKEVMPSAFEQLNQDKTLDKISGTGIDFFHKDVIVHYVCECGEEKVVRV